MANEATLITGASRHSLGEAIVREYLRRRPDIRIVVINKLSNPDLGATVGEIIMDLNPLNHARGLVGFAAELKDKIEYGITEAGCSGIECLVQGAAVYDFGPLTSYDTARRGRLLGLNILGTVEVLFSVCALNDRLRRLSEKSLTQIFVGAFQGLQVRAGRQLYASSKAWAIDFCAALVEGREIPRCLYVAPGPIDTPMLHRNHWVNKASGPEQFFEQVLRGTRAEYESIFLRCEESTLIEVAQGQGGGLVGELQEAMGRYQAERAKAKVAELGVMSAADCAAALVDTGLSPERGSGVYLIGTERGNRPFIKMASFESLDRNSLFLSVAEELRWPSVRA
jgi:NAD(P)-dependent dehydrogenase (short-subunit alcohol dehydrogenase family)